MYRNISWTVTQPKYIAFCFLAQTQWILTKALQLHQDISTQGEKVRKLKTEKAEKEAIHTAVNVLLNLKTKFKNETGLDWNPKIKPPVASSVPAKSADSNADEINEKIVEQGDKVRELKTNKAGKDEVTAAVAVLLDLKAKYKAATGQDWKPGVHKPSTKEASPEKGTVP